VILRKDIKHFFLRHSYLLIGAAWLLTIAFLTNNYWVYYSSPKGVQATLQRSIQERERAFYRIANDGDLMQQLLRRSYSDATLQQLLGKNKDFYFFVYSDNWETFWNTNAVNPQINLRNYKEGSYFLTVNQCDYELIKKNIGGLYPGQQCIIGLIPIREKYFRTNHYLPDQYFGKPDISTARYVLNRDRIGVPIRNIQGNILFYIRFNPNADNPHSNWISLLLKVLACISVLIFINLFAGFISQNSKRWHGLAFLFIVVLLLRLLSYYYPFPFNFHQYSLFDAQIYASSFILKSLGDMLINVLLLFWLILFFREQFQDIRLPKFKPLVNYSLAVAFCLGLYYIGKFFSDIVKSLVIDSKISFDVTNFYSINNEYSILGFITLGFIAFCFFFFSQTINNFIDQVTDFKRDQKYPILAVTGIIWLAFRFSSPDLGYSLVLMIWLIVYIIILDIIEVQTVEHRITTPFVFWLILLTITTTAILVYYNNQRENENRILFAERLANPNDIDTETFLGEISDRIDRDSIINNFFRTPSPGTKKLLVDYLQSRYFNSYLSKFDLHIFTFNNGYQPLFNNDTSSYSQIKNTIVLHSQPITPDLYFYEMGYNRYDYIGEKNIPTDSLSHLYGGYLFYELSTKTLKNETLYPVLLSQDSPIPPEYSDMYSYAVYDNMQLVYHYNDFPFSIQIGPKDIPASQYVYKTVSGYSQLWYKSSGNRVIEVVKRNRLFIEAITLFAYMFCIFLVISGAYQLMYHLIKARLRLNNLKQSINLTIRNQIHGIIIFTVVFAFLILGAATISFFISRYNKNHRDELSKNVDILSSDVTNAFKQLEDTALENKYGVEDLSDPSLRNKLQAAIYNIADIHSVDINIYDIDGNMQISTEQLFFDKGLLSAKMDPEAYYQLHYLNKIQFIHPETIGQLTYLSSYVPILYPNGEAVAYLNIPNFASENDLNQEISNFLIALINLNAFIFLLAGLLALSITNSITRSFTKIAEKLQKINLEKVNEEITWERNDEIGMLVNEFNKMVKKLEQSAVALAKSEREGAWREMAKQVAHEIKNPLTPMKLSLQHLQRAIRDDAANVKELTASVANTLIEQIEHLSLIAADFSAFAKISGTKTEDFFLNEVLNSVVNLYQNDERHLIIYDAPEENYIMHADKTEINRLFTNLLQNAIQAIPEGKKGFIEISLSNGNGWLKVMVKDNGMGIPGDIQPKIFTPNFTTKSSGTGLGLAMCRNIVIQAKGRIWFETEEGKGTAFFVELPLSGGNVN
jgi:signal transduction histidine kinase